MSTKRNTPSQPTNHVVVSETRRDVRTLTPDGAAHVLGVLISRVYNGENVQRHTFEAAGAGRKSEYSLGPTTSKFEFVNHDQSVEPLLDSGYTIKDQQLGRGGLTMITRLNPPDPITIPDPIHWDSELFNKIPDPKLEEITMVESSIKPGKAITYRTGWFRQVCTNGLVAEILKFPRLHVTHNNWTVGKVMDYARSGRINGSFGSGEYVGSAKGCSRLSQLLRSIKGSTEDQPEILNNLPYFARAEIYPFFSIPDWYRTALADQLDAMVQASGKSAKFHALDFINVATNPISLHQSVTDRSTSVRLLRKADTVLQACCKMAGIYSLS